MQLKFTAAVSSQITIDVIPRDISNILLLNYMLQIHDVQGKIIMPIGEISQHDVALSTVNT